MPSHSSSIVHAAASPEALLCDARPATLPALLPARHITSLSTPRLPLILRRRPSLQPPLPNAAKTCATSDARAPGRLKPQLGLDSSPSSLRRSDHRPGPCHAVRQPAGHAPAACPWAETGKALLCSHAPTAHPSKPSRQGSRHREAWATLLEDEQDPRTSTTILEGARPHGGKATLVWPSLVLNPALSSR